MSSDILDITARVSSFIISFECIENLSVTLHENLHAGITPDKKTAVKMLVRIYLVSVSIPPPWLSSTSAGVLLDGLSHCNPSTDTASLLAFLLRHCVGLCSDHGGWSFSRGSHKTPFCRLAAVSCSCRGYSAFSALKACSHFFPNCWLHQLLIFSFILLQSPLFNFLAYARNIWIADICVQYSFIGISYSFDTVLVDQLRELANYASKSPNYCLYSLFCSWILDCRCRPFLFLQS